MIIFLYGADDWRREQKKKLVIEEFKKKHSDLGVGSFDLSEDGQLAPRRSFSGVVALKEFIRAQSIFEKAKLGVVEGLADAKEEVSLAEELWRAAGDKKTTLLFSEKSQPVKNFGFLMSKPSVSQKFEHLAGPEWQAFIKKEAKRFDAELESDALNLLALVYQNNTYGLVTEIEKLSNLGARKITKADLEKLSLEALPNYWAVMNGLRSQHVSYRLSSLEKLFGQNEPAAKIFNILSSLWREKTPQMAEYDVAVKSGKLEYEESLLDLVLS